MRWALRRPRVRARRRVTATSSERAMFVPGPSAGLSGSTPTGPSAAWQAVWHQRASTMGGQCLQSKFDIVRASGFHRPQVLCDALYETAVSLVKLSCCLRLRLLTSAAYLGAGMVCFGLRISEQLGLLPGIRCHSGLSPLRLRIPKDCQVMSQDRTKK